MSLTTTRGPARQPFQPGMGWLVAGGLLIAAAALLLARQTAWRMTALAGALLSAALIGLNPARAVPGLHLAAGPPRGSAVVTTAVRATGHTAAGRRAPAWPSAS